MNLNILKPPCFKPPIIRKELSSLEIRIREVQLYAFFYPLLLALLVRGTKLTIFFSELKLSSHWLTHHNVCYVIKYVKPLDDARSISPPETLCRVFHIGVGVKSTTTVFKLSIVLLFKSWKKLLTTHRKVLFARVERDALIKVHHQSPKRVQSQV